MTDRWTQWIYQDAPRYGVDPRAADAISRGVEWPGRSGAGDAGTSFGPFQLHIGGALPHGRGRRWAESRAGVDYALAQMAAHGARGLRGSPAIAAISRNFERPADVAREISLASKFYSRQPGISGAQRVGAAIPRLAAHAARQAAPQQPDRRAGVLQYLMSGLDTYAKTGKLGNDPSALLALANMKQTAPVAPAPRNIPMNRPHGGGRGGVRPGKVLFSPTADRAGVATSGAVRQFVARLAGIAGHPIHVGTGTNHSRTTVNGNVSDHWSGHAADIPASGAALVKLGRQALIAAGMPRAKALKQNGGLYNVNGHQIIFNTHEGGDHTNHLHVSAH